MVAINAFMDLMMGGYGADLEESLANFPTYQDLVKILKGTATDADVDDLTTRLTNYIGQYSDYEMMLGGETPPISEDELTTIKTNLPLLVKALAPLLIADAKYTQDTYGESYSLYYTYSLVSNAENLVIGHIPESIMPILKSLILPDEEIPEEDIPVPSSGANTYSNQTEITTSYIGTISALIIASSFIVMFIRKVQKQHD